MGAGAGHCVPIGQLISHARYGDQQPLAAQDQARHPLFMSKTLF